MSGPTLVHTRKDAPEQASGEGGRPHEAPPETDVQRREAAKMRKREARVAEKAELQALFHAYGVTHGQLARWLGVAETHVERMLSPEYPDVNLAYGDRRLFPVNLQRAMAFGEIQRMSHAPTGALPRTERLCRVAREQGDVFRAEGAAAVREIDEVIEELQALRAEELARVATRQQ